MPQRPWPVQDLDGALRCHRPAVVLVVFVRPVRKIPEGMKLQRTQASFRMRPGFQPRLAMHIDCQVFLIHLKAIVDRHGLRITVFAVQRQHHVLEAVQHRRNEFGFLHFPLKMNYMFPFLSFPCLQGASVPILPALRSAENRDFILSGCCLTNRVGVI